MGRNLVEGARVTSTLPASFTLVTPSARSTNMPAPGRSVAFLVEPKAGAAPGVYPVRVETPVGISNILLFTLGTFHEVTEEESQPDSPPNRNDSIETAEPVPAAPVVVNGTLRGPERDMFRVSGKAGERRVFEVEARRCGSAIDPVLRILNGAGKQLARSDDTAGAGLDARACDPRRHVICDELLPARHGVRQLQKLIAVPDEGQRDDRFVDAGDRPSDGRARFVDPGSERDVAGRVVAEFMREDGSELGY